MPVKLGGLWFAGRRNYFNALSATNGNSKMFTVGVSLLKFGNHLFSF
jgi:hypothetical protein